MDLVDQLPPTAARLTAQAFGKAIPVGQAPAPVVHQGPAQARFQGSFGTGGGLDVEAKLKEQQCARESEQGGQQARGARMVEAVERVQGEARRAWQSRASELELCTKLKRDQRSGCISAVEQWLSGARSMTVRLPAGVETVQTACGARQPAYQAEVKVVSAIDLPVAEALLSRLKAGDFSLGSRPGLGSGITRAQLAHLDRFWAACEGGSVDACVEVGLPFMYGGSGLKDSGRAARIFRKVCDGGGARGCIRLGDLYNKGEGVSQSYSEAARRFQEGCDAGHGNGCHKLAALYSSGQGVRLSSSRASELYRRAVSLSRSRCESDDASECTSYGYLFDQGKGLTKSDSRANALYRKGCDLGSLHACNNLGIAHQYGTGVSISMTTARKYYQKACNMGYQAACTKLR